VTETHILCRSDIAMVVSLDDCIVALEDAWREQGPGATVPSGVLGVHLPSGGLHVKTAGLGRGRRRYVAAKLNANFPENRARHGLPTIQGVVALFDGDDGRLLALLDSMEITRLRTGAATAVAAKHLSRAGASRVALFGCGTQGEVQLQALSRVRPLRHVSVHDRDRSTAERLARVLRPALGVDIDVMDDEIFEWVRTSDLVVTCTSARSPFLRAEHVGPGTFIAAVGADREDKQELDVALLAAGHVVVDVLEQCAAFGELHHALDARAMTRADVRAELADVVAGRAPGRATSDEIVIFDSTGTGLEDVAAAALAFERTLAAGRGVRMRLGD
jgi:ornithine cyclodeaminase/alanine dehydrogenase-like protein (mu-crystallin family)